MHCGLPSGDGCCGKTGEVTLAVASPGLLDTVLWFSDFWTGCSELTEDSLPSL